MPAGIEGVPPFSIAGYPWDEVCIQPCTYFHRVSEAMDVGVDVPEGALGGQLVHVGCERRRCVATGGAAVSLGLRACPSCVM